MFTSNWDRIKKDMESWTPEYKALLPKVFDKYRKGELTKEEAFAILDKEKAKQS